MTVKRLLITVAVAATLAAGCAPPAPPTTPTAPATTVARPVLTHPTPGYTLMKWAPQPAYRVTFVAGTPLWLQNSVRTWAPRASAASGVALTVGGPASTGEYPEWGEIRVRVGALCKVEREAGCAVGWLTETELWGTDISVVANMQNHAYLPSVVAHEFGHALGLDHTPIDTRRHHPQVMGNPEGLALTAYQPGDLAGLAASGRRATQGVAAASVAEAPADIDAHPIIRP